MPTYFVASSSNATNIAASFQISGTTIIGSANLQGMCSSGGAFGEGYIGAISGTVNDDGTFTAGDFSGSQTIQGLKIQGTVPTAANTAWSGTVTFNYPSDNSQCAASFLSPFTATYVSSMTGAFSGTGELTFVDNTSGLAPAPGTTYSMSANLTQGAAGAQAQVTGTVQMTGWPCFTTGTTTSSPFTSSIESNVVVLNLTMNDGASVAILGSVNNTEGTQLAISGIYVYGDSCMGNYYVSTNPSLDTNPFLLNR